MAPSRSASPTSLTSGGAAPQDTSGRQPSEPTPGSRRTYVVDTSVLLSDPWALTKFAEHEVVLPLVVIGELEAKRHHPELGYFARQALRMLDDLRIEHGRLDSPIPIGEKRPGAAAGSDLGGTLHVELNHTDASLLPAGFRNDSNDSRILACALNLAAEGKSVILVSKDMPLRVKASAVGLTADEYRAQDVVSSGWTGMAELEVSTEQVGTLFHTGLIDADVARELPCNTGVKLITPTGSALGRVTPGKQIRLVRGEKEAFGLRGRSAEQRIALDLLMDDEVGIVSLGGRAGTGKSSSSVRCTRSAARSSDIYRVARTTRCNRGHRRFSTPCRRSHHRPWSTRSSREECSKCCH